MRIMGAADGVIIPTIMTAHMAKTNANSIPLHGESAGAMIPIPAGIIRKSLMSMPPMSMSTASHSTYAHASAASPARAAATTMRSRRSTVSSVPSAMVASLESHRVRMARGRFILAATPSMIGPADRRVMSVFAGIVPTHAVIAERIPGRSHGERQFVGADWMAYVRPHLPALMCGWQWIDRHVQNVRDFRRSLLAVNPIRDRHLLHPEVFGNQRRESRHRTAGGA